MKIPLSKIKPSPDNAAGRSEMNEAMEELIATIKAVGVCEGISVRPKGKGYEVIGGERRLFAAKEAGLKEVDAIVHDVTAEQARLMRLASLSHEDWSDAEFASAIWRELQERPEISFVHLSRMTGVSNQKISYYAAFHAAKLFDAVVKFDGEIKVAATSEIWTRFNPKKNSRYRELVKQITSKCSDEKIGYNMEVRKLCNRVKKALPNNVVFGEPEDKDYEEHNFELAAVLRIEWGEDDYEGTIKAMAESLHETNLTRWTAQRFGKKELKAFAKGANIWKDELRKILKFKMSFTWEQAQFTLNLLDEVDELVKGLTAELESVMEEKGNG